MSDQPDMLILAEERRGRELAERLNRESCVVHSDPYEALVAMRRRRWRAVVLTAPRADLPGLCRAVRRLQNAARIFAVCSPAAEAEVRSLTPAVVDDYFIDPPAPSDLKKLQDAALGRAAETAAGPERGELLGLEDVTRLIGVSTSMRSLEAHVAGLLDRYAPGRLAWADADRAAAGVEPLLAIDLGTVHRVLVPADGAAGARIPEELLATLRRLLPTLIAAARRTEQLHHLAIVDHLTGAYNRRYFYHVTDRILQRAGQRKLRAALLLFDIDDFKHYNDTYGHASGDAVLKDIAALMKGVTRAHDVVARIGGDEFAVLFWDADPPRSPGSKIPETPFVLADRFRKAVQNHQFAALGPEATGVLTISGGLASFGRDGRTCRELLRKADEALRAGKATGKNSITLIGSP